MSTHDQPEGAPEHYQPWLRNEPQASAPAAPADATPAVTRPQPLPTRAAIGVERARSDTARMSADELLARPLPPPAPPPPSIGERVADAASSAGQWVSDLEIPERVRAMDLGGRVRDAGSAIAKAAGKLGAASGQAAQSTAQSAKRLGDAAAPRLKSAVDTARDGLAAGVSRAGDAARKIADAAPDLPMIGHGKAAEAPPSQLDRLLAEEEVWPAAADAPVTSGLPLFAQESAPAASPAPATAAPAAPRPAAAREEARTAPTPSPAAAPSTAAKPAQPKRERVSAGGNGIIARLGQSPWLGHPGTWLLGGALLIALGFAAGTRWSGPGVNRSATETVVHDYILNHPDIIPKALDNLRNQQASANVNRLRAQIEKPFSGAWAGAASGDVTLTVFSDYFCTFCRASLPDIERLLREDRNLKIVFRELPILSQDSEPAARLALVAARHGRYLPAHRALFASGNANRPARAAIAEQLGIPADAASMNDAGITAELRNNLALARQLGFDGTPSWVVGNRALNGAVGYDELRAAVAEARAR